MCSGIALLGVDGDSKIRGNDTHNTFFGIAIGDTFVSSGVTASSTPGIEIKHNTMTDSYAGIIVDNDANDIHHNRSRLNLYGAYWTPVPTTSSRQRLPLQLRLRLLRPVEWRWKRGHGQHLV